MAVKVTLTWDAGASPAEYGDVLIEDFQNANRQLASIIAKWSLWVGRKVFDNGRQRFKDNSSPGLADDFLNAPVVLQESGFVIGEIGSNKPHARIRDEGGEIRAKRSRILSIPVHDKVRRLKGQRGPRDYKGTWVSREGKPPVFIEDDTGDVLFVGKVSVTQEGTRYFTDAWEERSGRALEHVAEDFFALAAQVGA